MPEALTPTRRQITEWSKLAQKKYRRERGLFLIEGEICVREALLTRAELEAVLALSSEADAWLERLPALIDMPVFAVNSETFARFSKPESSQGIVAIGRTFHLPARASRIAIACEQVSDPGNCGALIRVSDFFGARELLLGPESAELWNPKVVRGSMGSIFRQPVREDEDLATLIRAWPGSTVAAVAHAGQSLREPLALVPPVLLVLGHETRGLSQELTGLCSHPVTLAPAGDTESLNLVTAAAVFAYVLSGHTEGRKGAM